jgi:isoleucyl-tRNA synthetase
MLTPAETLRSAQAFVDNNIVLVSSKEKKMSRIPDLVDVWFDSGRCPMPNGIIHLRTRKNLKTVFRQILSLRE